MLGRIEWLAGRLDALDPGLLQHAEQLREHELHTLADVVVRLYERAERELERVEHGEQLLHEALRRPLEVLGLAPQHLLLVVLEVRLHLLGERAHLVALATQAGQVGFEDRSGFGRRVVTVVIGAARIDLGRRVLKRVVAGVHGQAPFASPSSTISASATSSSLGGGDPPSGPAPAPESAAFWAADAEA